MVMSLTLIKGAHVKLQYVVTSIRYQIFLKSTAQTLIKLLCSLFLRNNIWSVLNIFK